jgi:hypothetical protein
LIKTFVDASLYPKNKIGRTAFGEAIEDTTPDHWNIFPL